MQKTEAAPKNNPRSGAVFSKTASLRQRRTNAVLRAALSKKGRDKMNKKHKAAVICAAAVVVSTAVLLIIRLAPWAKHEAPQFVYTSSPQSEESTTAQPPASTGGTDISTGATDIPPEDMPQSSEAVLLTSNDPDNYFRFSFCEDEILVEGRYNSGTVALFAVDEYYAEPVFAADGSFTASLEARLDYDYYSLCACLDNGTTLIWSISNSKDGLRPVICDDVVNQNLAARDFIFDIPADAVAEYIVTNGTVEQRAEILREISQISAQVCSGIESDYDKARALAQWVSQNIYYDYDAFYSSVTTQTLSLGSTLSLHRSVCGGYANLYAALCQAQGIECLIAQGAVVQNNLSFEEADTAPSHEWNLVHIDGRYFWVDTLWNNSGNSYSGGIYTDGEPYMRYFDPTEEAMAQNHRADRIERREFFTVD